MYPHLKVQMSVGGWSGSRYFSDAALTPASRQAFVASCIDLFIKGNLPIIGTSPHGRPGSGAGVFDGIDLDWEWPASEGNVGNVVRPEDKQNLTAVLAELRPHPDQYGSTTGQHYSLTAFLPADPAKISAGIEVANVFGYLDFDAGAGVYWLFDGRTFWSYDDPHVLSQKTAYVKANGLGGTMGLAAGWRRHVGNAHHRDRQRPALRDVTAAG